MIKTYQSSAKNLHHSNPFLIVCACFYFLLEENESESMVLLHNTINPNYLIVMETERGCCTSDLQRPSPAWGAHFLAFESATVLSGWGGDCVLL